ncbi:hypothetical protein GCM10022247_06040 [Allokutzneria multivorans]|uniref:Polymerase nucleotidyl transferase domain-containing protein n=1 Tax=Allokutzneria multivorans TaxID=1142134 RepID=A0ABP7QZP9_9PSEU
MILTEDQLQALLDTTMERIDAGPEYAVVLEGSIAEGFGNSSSDIDFLLIADSDADLPTMPSVLFVDGRRVEVRTRSVRQLTQQFDRVIAAGNRVSTLDEDLLNRCQRMLRSFPLRRKDLVGKIKDQLPFESFCAVMHKWWAHRARHCLRHASALTVLGQHEEALSWGRAGLTQSMKSWAAGKGETYLEPKWLSLQLDRAGEVSVRDRYFELISSADVGASDCVEFAARVGITGCTYEPERLTVERAPGVTTWRTGARTHVVRGKQDVFALGANTAKVWGSVVFGRPLAAPTPEAGAIIARFLRLGLIRLSWRGAGTLVPALPLAAPAGPLSPPPSAAAPVLTVGGAPVTGVDAIDLLPLPAKRFGASAMTLVWSNVLIENAKEDLTGALDRQQWRVAELVTRRMVQVSLRSLLSAYGVNPLPPDDDLVRRLDLLPDTGLAAPARELESVRVSTPEEGRSALKRLEEFVAAVRAITGAGLFPSSFDSADTWRSTLDIGYDWLRLGAYLDADLPLTEAQDLLSSGGAQPHLTGGKT